MHNLLTWLFVLFGWCSLRCASFATTLAHLDSARMGDSGTFVAKDGLALLADSTMSTLARGASVKLKPKSIRASGELPSIRFFISLTARSKDYL